MRNVTTSAEIFLSFAPQRQFRFAISKKDTPIKQRPLSNTP